jgi:hypothetical protein
MAKMMVIIKMKMTPPGGTLQFLRGGGGAQNYRKYSVCCRSFKEVRSND